MTDQPQTDKPAPYTRSIKTPGGWKLEMDNDTWVQLMSALTIAIGSETRDGHHDQAKQFAALRAAFSRGEKSEGF